VTSCFHYKYLREVESAEVFFACVPFAKDDRNSFLLIPDTVTNLNYSQQVHCDSCCVPEAKKCHQKEESKSELGKKISIKLNGPLVCWPHDSLLNVDCKYIRTALLILISPISYKHWEIHPNELQAGFNDLHPLNPA